MICCYCFFHAHTFDFRPCLSLIFDNNGEKHILPRTHILHFESVRRTRAHYRFRHPTGGMRRLFGVTRYQHQRASIFHIQLFLLLIGITKHEVDTRRILASQGHLITCFFFHYTIALLLLGGRQARSSVRRSTVMDLIGRAGRTIGGEIAGTG